MWNILGDGPLNTSHASRTAPNVHIIDVLDDGVLAWQDRALCAQTDPEAF
ncbi:MAG: WhiB family transcriptional regulator, partial [Actinobacteria bacterium]|nr:WhiB family transcriptional regulator [Actinomycetota bacterium]